MWDAASGEELRCLRGHEDWVTSVAWSPDSARIVSGSKDRTVRVWDAASGEELHCLRGHENTVWILAYAPDGTRVASGSHDLTVRVWDTAMGQCVQVIQGEGDVRTIAAGHASHACRLFGLRGESALRDAVTDTPIAYYPVALESIATHPSATAWAGREGSHLHLIVLEQEDEE